MSRPVKAGSAAGASATDQHQLQQRIANFDRTFGSEDGDASVDPIEQFRQEAAGFDGDKVTMALNGFAQQRHLAMELLREEKRKADANFREKQQRLLDELKGLAQEESESQARHDYLKARTTDHFDALESIVRDRQRQLATPTASATPSSAAAAAANLTPSEQRGL